MRNERDCWRHPCRQITPPNSTSSAASRDRRSGQASSSLPSGTSSARAPDSDVLTHGDISLWAPAMASNDPRPCEQQSKSWHHLVERAENLARSDLDGPLRIPHLCRVLAVSERTLRKSFRQVHGVTPSRHLRMSRLSQARQALMSADCGSVTVTEIAISFGFVELGRFSVEYRKVYGESPSETLYRATDAEQSMVVVHCTTLAGHSPVSASL